MALDTARGSRYRLLATQALAQLYPGFDAHLTDSGTSALRLALELAFGAARALTTQRPVVAVPAYACPDIATAVVGAGGEMVLYDTDPHSLSPDWESVRRAMLEGAQVLVVAHLYGRVVDLDPARTIVAEHGAVLVEDAAQHAGGSINGIRGGGQADLGVLSFGRGKGLNAGGGGALLFRSGWFQEVPVADMTTGFGQLARASVSEILSRPWLFGVPARLPVLALGATEYRPPTPPAGISRTSAALLVDALRQEPTELHARQKMERRMVERLSALERAEILIPSRHETSGALRTPIIVEPSYMASRRQSRALGIVRSYPRTLADYPAFAASVKQPRWGLAGARLLAERTYTLPTHSFVGEADMSRIIRCFGAAS